MEPLRIGLVGWGTVGSALGDLVERGPLPIRLAWVAVREPRRERGVPLPEGVPVAGEPGPLDEIDALVELAGSVTEPRRWAEQALSAGLAYVTANKALLAAHGGELAELAILHDAAFLASASVGGGTPDARGHRAPGCLRPGDPAAGAAERDDHVHPVGHGRGPLVSRRAGRGPGRGLRGGRPSFDVEGRDAARSSPSWPGWPGAGGCPRARWRPRDLERGGGAGEAVRLVAEATPDGCA